MKEFKEQTEGKAYLQSANFLYGRKYNAAFHRNLSIKKYKTYVPNLYGAMVILLWVAKSEKEETAVPTGNDDKTAMGTGDGETE